MTAYVMPTAEATANMLGMLFGDDVPTTPNSKVNVAGNHVATFIDDDDKLVCVCACDPAFVGYSGAAMTMIPAGGAKDMIAENDFSKAILDNFYEVMNICSRLLMSDKSAHLRLDKCLPPTEGMKAIAALKDSAKVVSFTLEIPKYGPGIITFLVT